MSKVLESASELKARPKLWTRLACLEDESALGLKAVSKGLGSMWGG